MKDKFFDNADSFSMSFDEEWQNFKCDDHKIKIGGLTFWDYDDDYCTNK